MVKDKNPQGITMIDELKILVVDDEINVLKSIKKMLLSQYPQMTIDTAQSPSEGTALFEQNSYDLMISDFKMPEMTGLELIQKIQQLNDHIKFIIITGFATRETYEKALGLGVANFIPKPYTRDELITSIQLLF